MRGTYRVTTPAFVEQSYQKLMQQINQETTVRDDDKPTSSTPAGASNKTTRGYAFKSSGFGDSYLLMFPLDPGLPVTAVPSVDFATVFSSQERAIEALTRHVHNNRLAGVFRTLRLVVVREEIVTTTKRTVEEIG